MTRTSLTLAALFAAALPFCIPPAAQAHQITNRFYQAQQTDAYGRLTVEASIISVVQCNGAGENGLQFYVYAYQNRPGFRAIYPPYWSSPIGGHDFATFGQAASIACHASSGSQPSTPVQSYSPYAAGNWILTTGCSYLPGPWQTQIAEASDGSLTGWLGVHEDAILANDANWVNTIGMRSVQSGSTVDIAFNPPGWESVVDLQGTLSGNTITGTMHHYGRDDCSFRLTRQ